MNNLPITLQFLSGAQKRFFYRKSVGKSKWYYPLLRRQEYEEVIEDPSLPLEQQVYLNGKNIFYKGYWQSAGIVNSVRDVLLRELQPFPKLSAESQKLAAKISACGVTTAVHLRTAWKDGMDITDSKKKIYFQHSQTSLSRNYYVNAINHIKDFCGSSTFFVFADDPAAAKSVLSGIDFPGDVFYLSHHQRSDWEDLFLMQLCQNFILSNSSFSWWGHWFSYALNPYRKSLVIMPENWMGYGTDRSRSLRLQTHDQVLLISDS